MISGAVWLLVELVALFFGVAFAIQLLQQRLGPDRVRIWMGGRPTTSALKGIAVGFVTPFCTYSAIPLLVGLRRAGVPPAGYVAFLAAAPVLDPVLFGALTLIVGIEAAVIYSLVAFVSAVMLALTAQRVGIDQRVKEPALVPASGGASSCDRTPSSDTTRWLGLAAESRMAARSAGALLRSMAPLLLVGVGIGLMIEAVISPDQVGRLTGGTGTWSIPVAAALGTPLYFHTGLFVPIANSLSNAGVGIGAIVALTISGAGANIPEFVVLTKLAPWRLIAAFFIYVFVVAMAGGLLAQWMIG